MALGARGAEVRGMLLRDALVLVGVGVLSGVPLAVASGHLFKSFLYGLSPYDAPTLAGSVVLMLAVAVIAAYLPARRASRVDPMVALRYE
jgi:ABC-type antimicrobial peptide transport system permease subunit